VLYGIWNVERLSVDGQVRPAELNDYDRRWRRVIFDTPGEIVFQRTDDSFARYGLSLESSRGRSRSPRAAVGRGPLASSSIAPLTIDSRSLERWMATGSKPICGAWNRQRFPLLNSRFRWVRPHDP
jgi:hypothetical protein